jgi:hypothetical protein
LAISGFERYAKTTRRATFLAEMEQVVPWRRLCLTGDQFVAITASAWVSPSGYDESTGGGCRRTSVGCKYWIEIPLFAHKYSGGANATLAEK